MSIQHKDIPDGQRHPPKGFEGADSETVQVKNNSGLLEWRKLSEMGAVPGPPGSTYENVIIVQKNPAALEFADPVAALAAITDASSSNPYVVLVGPGIYQLASPLIMKEGVTVKSMGNSTVVFEPVTPTNDIVQMAVHNCRIQGITLRNATGANAAAIRITGGSPLPAVLDYITIQNCTEQIVIESSTALVQAVLRNIRLIAGSTTKKLLRITATGGFGAIARIYSAILTDDVGTVFEDAIFLTGPGSRVDANTVLARSTVGVGNGIHLVDGAEFVSQSGAEIEFFDKNLFVENSGADPIVRTTTIMLRQGVTWDLQVAHPGTSGSILAKANVDSKVMINDDATIKLQVSDPNPANMTGEFILGDLLQATVFSQRINLSKLLRASATMGRISGGTISDDGGFNVRVTAGNGFLIDPTELFVREVNWIETVVTIDSESSVYIFVNSNGIVDKSASLPDLSKSVVLGRVSTSDSGVHIIQRTPMEIAQFGNKSSDFYRSAFGPIYVSGSLVAENGVTARALDITPGNFWFGVKNFLPIGGIAVQFEEFYRKVGSGFNIVTGATQVNNTHYDDGSGTLAALGAGKFVAHALYLVGDGADEKYMFQFAQTQYDSLVEAEGADIPAPPTSFGDAVVLIARIITEEGNAALRIYDSRPVLGFKASGVSASANHSNLFGLLADDHPQYLLANGGRSMSGNLNMGGNNVTNVGTVDGVDVSNHAARHAPTGADPLPTATPVEITDSTNAEGSSNNFARGGHQHAHGNRGGGSLHALVTTLLHGFMSNVDKQKLDGIAAGATANQTDAFLLARANHTGTQLAATISDFSAAVNAIITALKGAANGLVPLDGSSLIPSVYLPSYVDDVLEFANLAGFPVTGEVGKIYVALDTNKTYRWSGSIYVEISPSEVVSVNGQVGIVSLLTTHIGEGTNLYYTQGRFDTAFAAKNTGNLAEGSNLYYTQGRFDTAFAAKSTSNLAEGSNLYFTDARARNAVSAVSPLSYNAGNGQFSIPAAAGPSTNGYMSGADKAKLDILLNNSRAYQSGTVTTGTRTDALVSGMTLTPAAGTYLAIANCNTLNTGAETNTYSLYAGGVQVPNTEKPCIIVSSFGAESWMGMGIASPPITVNGSQAIELRARTSGGTMSHGARDLLLIRIA